MKGLWGREHNAGVATTYTLNGQPDGRGARGWGLEMWL